MAEEKSSGFVGKVIGGVFAAVIAPIVVALAIKYSDRLFPAAQTNPASPQGTALVASIGTGEPKAGRNEPRGHEPKPAEPRPAEPKGPEKKPELPALGRPLFNARDLTDFFPVIKGHPIRLDPQHVFLVQDGHLHVSGAGPGALMTDQEYENYQLSVEYRWGKPAAGAEAKPRQSGILLHCIGAEPPSGAPWPESIRCQILRNPTASEGGTGDLQLVGPVRKVSLTVETDSPFVDGAPKQRVDFKPGAPEEKLTLGVPPAWPGIVHRAESSVEAERPIGEVNKLECTCEGDRITVKLNDKVVNVITHVTPSRGKIALLSEGAEIIFQQVDLKHLRK